MPWRPEAARREFINIEMRTGCPPAQQDPNAHTEGASTSLDSSRQRTAGCS
jgi:hypothetical protein